MIDLLVFINLFLVTLFLLYVCVLINAQRDTFHKKLGFLDLWMVVGSLAIRTVEDFNESDKERLRDLHCRVRRAVFVLVLSMVATSMLLVS